MSSRATHLLYRWEPWLQLHGSGGIRLQHCKHRSTEATALRHISPTETTCKRSSGSARIGQGKPTPPPRSGFGEGMDLSFTTLFLGLGFPTRKTAPLCLTFAPHNGTKGGQKSPSDQVLRCGTPSEGDFWRFGRLLSLPVLAQARR